MKKDPKLLPSVSAHDVDQNLPKTEAILVRLSKADKKSIVDAAAAIHLTVTEFMVKSALLVAGSIPKD